MDNFGMMRSPSLTPAATLASPTLHPPPILEESGSLEDGAHVELKPAGLEPVPLGGGSLSLTFRGQSSSFGHHREHTELDYGPDGHLHVKPRHYKAHSPTISGRLLDFVGVPTHLTISGMLWSLCSLFVPATATTILYFCNQAITMMFVGQLLGTESLAHYAVGISVFNICGLSIGLGFATGLDTLCSQAYGRDPKGPEVGILLQRGLLICLSLGVPVVIAFYTIEPLLIRVFGPALGVGISNFLVASPPYLAGLIINFCLQKALQAQHLPILAVWANVASALACPVFNYWLTPHGVRHAVAAVSLSVYVAVIVMAAGAYLHPKSVMRLAPWPARAAFSREGAMEFVRVGFPAMLSVVSEWWAFEFIIAFSASYGENVVTAFTICMNILTFMFAIPSGLAVAAGVMCGNFLGANDPRGAQSFARMAIVIGAVVTFSVNCGLFVFGNHVFRLYTNDKHVLKLMQNVLVLLAVFHVGDATQTVLQGIFRGAGRQAMSARIVLSSLWLVGLPMSWYLGSVMKPLDGILMGLIAGFIVEIPMLTFDMLFRWDWDALAAAAAESKLEEELSEQRPLTTGIDRAEGKTTGYGTV
jgi:MATE family multidrug resistance protein